MCATLAFDKNRQGTPAAWCSASERVADYRSMRASKVMFDEDDRARQTLEGKRKKEAKSD